MTLPGPLASLGTLGFAHPWLLLALAGLPLLWWLVRRLPPAPRRVVFAPLALLRGLSSAEAPARRAPWWLIVLRLLVLSLIVVGLAGPRLDAGGPPPRAGGGLLLVVDNGWAALADWPERRRMVARLIAERAPEGPLWVLPTAPDGQGRLALAGPLAPARALDRLVAHPWPTERARAADLLAGGQSPTDLPADMAVIWLSDGLAGQAAPLAGALAALGPVSVIAPPPGRPLALLAGEGDAVVLLRPRGGPAERLELRLADSAGRTLDRRPLALDSEQRRLDVEVAPSPPVAAHLATLAVARPGAAGPAAPPLLRDPSARPPRVGLVAAELDRAAIPLLGETYYLERALAGSAEVRSGDLAGLLETAPDVLILAGVGHLAEPLASRLEDWMAEGGSLIRFAGPRLLPGRPDPLLPVPLAATTRQAGGPLTWGAAPGLAAFPEDGPLAGLEVDPEVRVRTQLLARPEGLDGARVWARLSDGTPLITARRRGAGWLVLVHTAADPGWSDLPLSGLFPQLLERLVRLPDSRPPGGAVEPPGGRLAPRLILTAEGRLAAPPASLAPLTAGAVGLGAAPGRPPGLYGPPGAGRVVQVLPPGGDPPQALTEAHLGGLSLLPWPDRPAGRALGPWLLLAAVAGLLLDGALVLVRPGRRVAVAVLLLLAAPAGPAVAEDGAGLSPRAVDLALAPRLGCLPSGAAPTDRLCQAGLAGLTRVLARRTAVELAEPELLDPAADPLSLFPLLYWPILEATPTPPPPARARLDDYLRRGGLLILDAGAADDPAAGRASLGRIGRALALPPLAQVPRGHLLGRTFYLLDDFPGRLGGAGRPWIEARAVDESGGAVSAVVVGHADWAGAWASDAEGRPLRPLVPGGPDQGGPEQREMATRVGVNLVMYALTGTYKADQVHLPAILERLTR
ncbi:DUF4159 domain-containing protein [Roseospirillum parvum]|uniref:N-terminal double-transmembrane domain-containing protein n=1 Tax=Roseospirillum parvum TaxID=83401 RepID=A0A1G7ZRJ9_9PROT|nr:DUF4159 domain-containing protein [Roseospirillum parvum]SDH11305.1 N-terminal double-transmembrane domain-containing protein [Roseospirillum parvum]